MFIPIRLEIKQAPQYVHFPLNVVFGATKLVDGKETLWTTVYEPDFSLYEKSDDGSTARMGYHNRLNRAWSLVITWKNIDGKESYTALKFSPDSEKPVIEAHGGSDWDKFFEQLTIIGPAAGESCKISPVTEAPKQPDIGMNQTPLASRVLPSVSRRRVR